MAASRDQDQPWSSHEKNYMLAEIIKAANPHPNVLWGVIHHLGITQPNLYDIPMPPGRSVNSGLRALDDVRRSQHPPIMHGAVGGQTPSPMSGQLPTALGKRSFYESSIPPGREIRPKPSSASGTHSRTSPEEHPQKRKRGRPKKGEGLANAETRIAGAGQIPRFEEVGPPSAGPFATQIVETPVPTLQPPPPPLRPVPPPAPRMEISSMLTPTGPPNTSQSGSSSGKRKRARSTRSEPDPGSDAGGTNRPEEYESPYGRANPEPTASPARTAVLRHREGSESAFLQSSYQGDAHTRTLPKPEPHTDSDGK